MSAPVLRRVVARKLIDQVRVLVAKADSGHITPGDALKVLALALQRAGLPPLEECQGEAHSNPFIDNCGSCAPRWEWIGKEAKIT